MLCWNSSWSETMMCRFGIKSVCHGATTGVTIESLEIIDIEEKHLKTKEKYERGRGEGKNGLRLALVHRSCCRNQWIGEATRSRGRFGSGVAGFLVQCRWSEKMEKRVLVGVVSSLVVWVRDCSSRNNGEKGRYKLGFVGKVKM